MQQGLKSTVRRCLRNNNQSRKNHKKVHVCDTTILKWATPIFKNPKESVLQIPTQLCDANGKHLQLKNNEFVSLVQTLNNFVPSISSASDRYVCFDNLFKADFNLKPPDVNGYITYNSFINLLANATYDQTNLAGLYPIGNNPNGYTHYYVVIPTSFISNRDGFVKWFGSRGALPGYTQDTSFVEKALESPFVILNGYIKGESPLDTTFKDKIGHFALGANIQPAQALCAFNAITLGLAFGLPAYRPFISSCALETCYSLKLGPSDRSKYEYNERHILTFLAKVLYATTNGPFEPESSFLNNLATGSNGGQPSARMLQKAINLLSNLNKFSNTDLFPIVTEKGVNIMSIFKIILSPCHKKQFNYWSRSD